VISTVAKHAVEPLAFGKSVVARPAPEVLMWSVAPALPEIFGCGLHPCPPIRSQLDAPFAMEMSIFALYPRDACDS
jgi:hypothetical protein